MMDCGKQYEGPEGGFPDARLLLCFSMVMFSIMFIAYLTL